MIDWSKAPEGATHGLVDKSDGVQVGWSRAGGKYIYLSPEGVWTLSPPWVESQHDMVARPEPRTQTDELLDMIKKMREKAYHMGYESGYLDHMRGERYDAFKAYAEDINQLEKQS